GRVHILAGAREVAGTLPQAYIFENRAARLRPWVGGRQSGGIEQLAALEPGEAAESNRGVGHPEGSEPDLWNGGGDLARDHGQCVEIGGLALIRGHPRGRVALDMLDGPESFTGGQLQIAGRHIVLPVNECLLSGLGSLRQGARKSLPASLWGDHPVSVQERSELEDAGARTQ